MPESLMLLLLRIGVAMVFWKSGFTKLDDWNATLFLFQDEYRVPLLPTEVAAVLGTVTEIGGSIALILGLRRHAIRCSDPDRARQRDRDLRLSDALARPHFLVLGAADRPGARRRPDLARRADCPDARLDVRLIGPTRDRHRHYLRRARPGGSARRERASDLPHARWPMMLGLALQDLRCRLRSGLDEADRRTVQLAIERLQMLQIAEQGLQAGDILPDFELIDAAGQRVTGDELLCPRAARARLLSRRLVPLL